jgi:uncharacterized protein (TIGR04540 family)
MKIVYRNPKELATKVKDLVDGYFDGIIPYEKFEESINSLMEKNYDRVYKNGHILSKIVSLIGEEGEKAIDEIVQKQDKYKQ